jgi:hypothetical protein
MSLLNFITTNIKEHPFTSGLVSSASTTGIGIIGVLSEEGTVRLIASIGGLFGIMLTVLSIYHKIKREKEK